MKFTDKELETIHRIMASADMKNRPQVQQIERNLIEERFRQKIEQRRRKKTDGTILATGNPFTPTD